MAHATEREWRIAKLQIAHDKAERSYDTAMADGDYDSADYYLGIMMDCAYKIMELKITFNGNYIYN